MKRTLLFLLGVLPIFAFAQENNGFFKNVTTEIEKTGINTVASDFGPSFVEDQLWVSAFTGEEISLLQEGKTKNVFYNVYAIPVDSKGNITGDREIKLEGVSHGYHAGPVSFCPKTDELFVTLSNFENPKIENIVFQKAKIPLKIIVMRKAGKGWDYVRDLPFNSSDYSVGHPAISSSGDTLFFVSDIPGKGKGGTDIYMSVRENGQWSDMKNLGDEINTSGDEMFPYLFNGNTLIYASNGKEDGQGGLDLYYAERSGNHFGEPQNLTDLNSPEDDFALTIHRDKKTGYFTSKRSGGEGDDDIYKVLFGGEFQLELLVRDKKSREPFPNARVEFSDGRIMNTGNNGLITRELEPNTDYKATSQIDGYMNDSKSFSTEGKLYGLIRQTLEVEKVEVGQKFEMENIYYDFDKWNILPESEVELDKLVKVMEDNPSWEVELGSHTDSRGSDSYNDWLSQKRSESAVDYIVSHGISRNRITAKGYGETQLVNECDDGVPCTKEQHRMNRRTEFKILKMD